MGYALFANRKLVLTNTVNMLQLQLDQIMMQRNNLTQFSANICDGYLTAEEMVGDATNLTSYQAFLKGLNAYANSDQVMEAQGQLNDYTTEEVNQMNDSVQEQQYLFNMQSLFDREVREKYAEAEMKKIAVQENKLEMQQKKIETQLTKAQNDLKAVEEAEGQAIQNATPKFAGLG